MDEGGIRIVGEGHEVARARRDPAESADVLRRWLAARTGDPMATVVLLDAPTANGMSSESLLVDAEWDDGSGRVTHHLVVRVAPEDEDVPLFPTYDLGLQHRVMEAVGQHTSVPVPKLWWYEGDSSHLGSEFIVMDRVAGRLPADIPPYTFEGWLLEATVEDRRRLQDGHVGLIAGLHSISKEVLERDLPELSVGEGSALRGHVDASRGFYEWARAERRYAVIEAGFDWLEEHWPADEGDTVLSWGDSRMGNVIFDGFTPVATLDWEMASVGPRGLDLGWAVFMHTFFQDIAEVLELPGLPDLFLAEDVAATYEALTGVPAQSLELDFHVVYAAVRHAIIMSRVHQRQVRFGEAAPVEDPDEGILHRARLQALLEGRERL